MHAGTGIVHAEYNREPASTRLFQIWIEPDRRGAVPGWLTRQFPRENGLAVLASGRAQDVGTDALPLHADAAVLAGTLRAGAKASVRIGAGRRAYLVAATGSIAVNGIRAGARDGVAISDESGVDIVAAEDSEVVLVDVAA
jgi:redox-sensitive bicupin YhaK (pirin superfamily)